MYERLKGREDLDPIQERICLLVHAHKRKTRFAEIETLAVAVHSEGDRALPDALKRLQALLFPGHGEIEDDFVKSAKKQLEEATKSVFVIKPHVGMQRAAEIQKAAASTNPAMRGWARQAMEQEQRAQKKLAQVAQRKKRSLPEGAIEEER